MSTSPTPIIMTIPRTAPIPIAAAKPKSAKSDSQTTPARANSSKPKQAAGSSSIRSLIEGSLPNTRSRKDRPCDACRRRKSKCVIHEGETACVLCKFHTQDCTFLENPQPRKRKQNPTEAAKEDEAAKRRYLSIHYYYYYSDVSLLIPLRSPRSPCAVSHP
jgi:hypothetical protein